MDAYQLGFLPGFREDGGYQSKELNNVDLPVGFLDNDFSDPDLDRFLDVFEEADPSVAVVGDAYTLDDAELYDQIVQELNQEYPFKEFVVVPKTGDAFNILSNTVTLGVPNGYSEIDIEDLEFRRFRGRDIHILGGAPDKQYRVIEDLTQPNLSGDPPANVVGVDWNGPHKVAYKGEYWSRTSGYQISSFSPFSQFYLLYSV